MVVIEVLFWGNGRTAEAEERLRQQDKIQDHSKMDTTDHEASSTG